MWVYMYIMSSVLKQKLQYNEKKKLSRKSVVYAGPFQDKILLVYNKVLPRFFKNYPRSTEKKSTARNNIKKKKYCDK